MQNLTILLVARVFPNGDKGGIRRRFGWVINLVPIPKMGTYGHFNSNVPGLNEIAGEVTRYSLSENDIT